MENKLVAFIASTSFLDERIGISELCFDHGTAKSWIGLWTNRL